MRSPLLSRRTALAATVAVSGALTLSAAAPSSAGSPQSSRRDLDLETATIASLRKLLDRGRITSVQLAQAYIDRISDVNTDGPGLRAVQSIVTTWKEQARAADVRRAKGRTLGPLDGIPVIVKDNFDIAGQATTAGSLALAQNIAQSDAGALTKLRAAGAVIIAKATMVEFAFWNGVDSWGYSSLGGQPLNPYDASYSTSGSSAGSAIAAAAGLAAITYGSDTGGSVITPAQHLSVVGYRPTTGMSSRTGIVPITTFSDTPGVLGRTVTDVALGAAAIAGIDSTDPATAASAPYQGVDLAGQLSKKSLRGKRVGVVASTSTKTYELTLWNAAVAAVKAAGAVVVPITYESTAFPFDTTTYEFRRNLDEYLADRTADDFPIKDVHELADFYRADPEDTQKYGASTLFAAEAVDLEADRAAAETQLNQAQTQVRSRLDALFAQNTLDVLLFPQDATIFLDAALGSYPEVTVPAGYLAADRHPYAVLFVGKRWSDAAVLNYAFAYEQATSLRRTPSQINPTMWRCVGSSRPGGNVCLP